MLWQGEGRSGLGRTSPLGSSRGPHPTKWWQNCALICLTSHWTRPGDGNRCVDTSLMSLARNARDVELNHSGDERWKERIRDEREIAQRGTAEWGLRALLIHNMASLSYIRIFCGQGWTGFFTLLCGNSKRERRCSMIPVLCRGIPWRFVKVWTPHLCWNLRDCQQTVVAWGRGGVNMQVILCTCSRFGTEETGANPQCVGDFFLIISGIG